MLRLVPSAGDFSPGSRPEPIRVLLVIHLPKMKCLRVLINYLIHTKIRAKGVKAFKPLIIPTLSCRSSTLSSRANRRECTLSLNCHYLARLRVRFLEARELLLPFRLFCLPIKLITLLPALPIVSSRSMKRFLKIEANAQKKIGIQNYHSKMHTLYVPNMLMSSTSRSDTEKLPGTVINCGMSAYTFSPID